MSEYPASLGDLADVEARLEGKLARLVDRLEVNDQETIAVKEHVGHVTGWLDVASAEIARLHQRVSELEGLWAVAKDNPELVRELAVQALKGPSVR